MRWTVWARMAAMILISRSSTYQFRTQERLNLPFAKVGTRSFFDPWTTAALLHDLEDQGLNCLAHPAQKESVSFRYGQCELVEHVHKIHPRYEHLFASCFHDVVDSMAHHGYTTRLDRFDLFHGHLVRLPTVSLFSAMSRTSTSFALLFHCYEYPARNSSILPGTHLGYCQRDSTCCPTLEEWRFRNVLSTLGGRHVWLLDGAAPAVADCRVDSTPFGPNCPNTVWEAAIGDVVADIYFIENDVYYNHHLHLSRGVVC